jgi:choline-glycine betaine transporter
MGGALGRSMTESHEKMTFFYDASWKAYFSPKVGVLIALISKP